MSDEKKCVLCLALVILMGFILFYTYIGDSQNQYEGIVRLHVLANSDTVEDQALKLKVRDAVIEYMEKQDDLNSAGEAREYLSENLNRLEKIAEGVIASEGYDYSARADLGVRYIPEKAYGGITFPAGNYEALNITIGRGEGENWWCVLFPPLCLLEEGTATDDEVVSGDEASEGNNDDEGSSEARKLRLRWKLAEILNEGQDSQQGK
ncbi:MAG: stage II sporulation protein R [Anaerovoracaceae bacterium]|uniref:stage II sporulation protein R n=1 Tax=Gallibacter sp. Marseille-QA0791 TaxID=3378781 RepID=UPI003A11DF70